MADIIAVLVLAVLIGGAAAYIVKAKKSGAACIGCSAGGSCAVRKPPKKKLEGPVIETKTMMIEGMHCAHCVNEVTMNLNQIDGVRADVNLAKGQAVVSCDREIQDELLKNTVEKLGYQVTSVRPRSFS